MLKVPTKETTFWIFFVRINNGIEVVTMELAKFVYLLTLENYLTLYFAMSQNGQSHFKNLAAFRERFLAWPNLLSLC